MKTFFYILVFLFLLFANVLYYMYTNEIIIDHEVGSSESITSWTNKTFLQQQKEEPQWNYLDTMMQEHELVNLHEIDSTIVVSLAYSSEENVFEKNLYDGLQHCYLQMETAIRLQKAQSILQLEFAHLSLKILDCARAKEVQIKMWQTVKGTPQQHYVSSPENHSLHNYGVSVDVTIVDTSGVALNMGSAFDEFSQKSQPKYEAVLLKQNIITTKHIENRELLRGVMKQAGFWNIPNEWWHFNDMNRNEAAARYELIE